MSDLQNKLEECTELARVLRNELVAFSAALMPHPVLVDCMSAEAWEHHVRSCHQFLNEEIRSLSKKLYYELRTDLP